MKTLIEQISPAAWLAIAGWLAYELRQWRIWYQDNHGGAPDAPPLGHIAQMMQSSKASKAKEG